MNSNLEKNYQPTKFSNVYLSELDLWLNVKLCDLLLERADIIVNASNTELILGGGISGAIRINGGSSIQEELNEIRKIIAHPIRQVHSGSKYPSNKDIALLQNTLIDLNSFQV